MVEADASDPAATGPAVGALTSIPVEALKHDLKGAIAITGGASQPFEVVVQRRYNPEGITSYNIVPGLLGIVLSMTLVPLAGAKRSGIVFTVKSAGSQASSSAQVTGADTRASGLGRTEYAELTVRSFAFWL